MTQIIRNPYVVLALAVSVVCILLTVSVCVWLKCRESSMIVKLMGGIALEVGNAQTIGTREKQDDSFGSAIKEECMLAVVADGIGGYINGNLASKITVDTYLDEFERNDVLANVSFFFQKSAVLANERIRDEFGEAKGGTTLVGVVIEGNKMHWTSVGDSNIAVFRKGRLIMVNRKENVKNWLEDQYFAGAIGREEAMGGPVDKRLVNYVGYEGFQKVDESDRPIFLKKGDKILLYSDGVETLSQIEIEKILTKKISAHKLAQQIITAVEQKQVRSKDNATIIVLSVKKG